MKKYNIQYRINNQEYKFEESKLCPQKWAIQKGCLPESIHRDVNWVFTGTTANGDEITFWKN